MSKLIMTLLVRDEEDILENNICFHLNQGVDYIVATDNGSVDGSREILEKYSKKGVLSYQVIADNTYEQSKWVSAMARKAREEYGATHLFHCDADEFWYSKAGNIKKHLPNADEVFYVSLLNYIPPKIDICSFSFSNFKFAVNKPGKYPLENPVSSCILLYKYPRKVLTPSGFDSVYMGNHDVIKGPEVKKIDLGNELIIHHFSIRNYRHFEKKVVNGGIAYENNPDQNPKLGWHWKKWYSLYKRGLLKEEYMKLSLEKKKSA